MATAGDHVMIDSRLDILCKNLKAIEAVKEWGRLRIVPLDTTQDNTDGPITIDTHQIQIEDRLFQGWRRARTGDGRRMTLAFVEHVLDQCKALANKAFEETSAHRSGDTSSLFDLEPLEAMQRLVRALLDANRGLTQLKATTYADSQQMVLDIGNLIGHADGIAASINRFLITIKPVAGGLPGTWPPL